VRSGRRLLAGDLHGAGHAGEDGGLEESTCFADTPAAAPDAGALRQGVGKMVLDLRQPLCVDQRPDRHAGSKPGAPPVFLGHEGGVDHCGGLAGVHDGERRDRCRIDDFESRPPGNLDPLAAYEARGREQVGRAHGREA
jgi:hypothetical protein